MNVPRTIGLTGTTLLCLALVSTDQGSPYAEEEFVELPVRAHLVHSLEGGHLHCTRSESAVEDLVRQANSYWRQAGIRWVLESIVPLEIEPQFEIEKLLHQETADDAAKHRTRKRLRHMLESTMPASGWLQNGLDLVLLGSFGAYGGGYYAGGGRVFLPQNGVVEIGHHGEVPPVILAHEFGHALGLRHAPCGRRDNIMLGRCDTRTRNVSRLEPDQIRLARRRATAASTGRR